MLPRGVRSHPKSARLPMARIFDAPLPWGRTRHSTVSHSPQYRIPSARFSTGEVRDNEPHSSSPSTQWSHEDVGHRERQSALLVRSLSCLASAVRTRCPPDAASPCSRPQYHGKDEHKTFSGDLGFNESTECGQLVRRYRPGRLSRRH